MRKSQARIGVRPWRVGIASAAAAAAVVASAAAPALAVGTLVVSPAQVSITGGTMLYITGGEALDTNTAGSGADLGIRYVSPGGSAACPTTYDGTSATSGATTVDGGAITVVSEATAYDTTPALPAGTYKPCLYIGVSTDTNGGSDTSSDGSALFTEDTPPTGTVTSVYMGTVAPDPTAPTTKITLTAESGIFTSSSYSTQFVSTGTGCPTTFSTATSSIITATTAKTSTSVLTITLPSTLTAGTPYFVCAYAGSTASSSALAARGSRTFTTYSSSLPAITVAPTGGSSATATNITVTAGSAVFSGASPAALITKGTCPLTYAAGSTGLEPYAATVTKITTSKVAVAVPTTVVVGGADVTTPWNVCVYASTSGALLATPATYTVAPVLTVSGAQFAVGSGSASGTASGPSQGGSPITVSGLAGIPTAPGALLTATLGGSPITNIVPIDSGSFSGVTSAHAPGAVTLAVTTAAGTRTKSGTPYTYTYGITVSPNTAASGSTPVLDITGAGFSSVTTWGTTATTVATAASTGYVFLTNNAWNVAALADGPSDWNAMDDTTPPISYCNSVLAISDTEIICTLDLDNKISGSASNTPTIHSTNVPDGTYTITVANDATDLDAYENSIVSSGSTFTVASF